VDAAWSDRLVSYRSLDALIARMSQRGRRGLALLRDLVAERGPDHVPPASNLESRVAQILANAGLPAMRRQVDSGDGDGWIGRVDFRADAAPLVLEVQSERFHRGLTAEDADRHRLARLASAGFEVVEVTDREVFHEPQAICDRVAVALARASMHTGRPAA
jgi:very-short-patch-repair endonuclease